MQTIELQVNTLKNGKFHYSAVLDGKVIATRTSNRVYVAALLADNGYALTYIGRPDLIDGAIRKNPEAKYFAVISESKTPVNNETHPRGTKVKVVERLTGHPFEVGQTVSLGKYLGSGKCYLAEDDRGLTGFVHISEFETLLT